MARREGGFTSFLKFLATAGAGAIAGAMGVDFYRSRLKAKEEPKALPPAQPAQMPQMPGAMQPTMPTMPYAYLPPPIPPVVPMPWPTPMFGVGQGAPQQTVVVRNEEDDEDERPRRSKRAELAEDQMAAFEEIDEEDY